jgi:hypothetical protein
MTNVQASYDVHGEANQIEMKSKIREPHRCLRTSFVFLHPNLFSVVNG